MYSISDNTDFFDIPEIIKFNGFYKGSIIKFHDYETKDIYAPFELKKNISYGRPTYLDGIYYFLKADFNEELVTIYKYFPDLALEKVADFKIWELNLYNLEIIGTKLYLVSSDENLEIYYPVRKTIEMRDNESVMFIEDNKIYSSLWIEENWDDENNIAGSNYRYYDKFCIRNMDGEIIHEQVGNLYQHTNGEWWLS